MGSLPLATRLHIDYKYVSRAVFRRITMTFDLITGRNEVVAKVIFLHLSVILFTGRGSVSVHAGIPPPRSIHTPPEADSGIRSMSGRYASYWNAFLLINKFGKKSNSKILKRQQNRSVMFQIL